MDIENIFKLDRKALEIIANANKEISLIYKKWQEEKKEILKFFEKQIREYEKNLKETIQKELKEYENNISKKYEKKLNSLNFDEKEKAFKIYKKIKDELCLH